jgi:hypothetical protein
MRKKFVVEARWMPSSLARRTTRRDIPEGSTLQMWIWNFYRISLVYVHVLTAVVCFVRFWVIRDVTVIYSVKYWTRITRSEFILVYHSVPSFRNYIPVSSLKAIFFRNIGSMFNNINADMGPDFHPVNSHDSCWVIQFVYVSRPHISRMI